LGLYTVSVTVPKAVLLRFAEHWCGAAETFKVDINNTVDLLKGETGQTIHERGIVVRFCPWRVSVVSVSLNING
jgi:hypothetical protein